MTSLTEGSLTYHITGDTAEVVSVAATAVDLTVPARVRRAKVTSIADDAFADHERLRTVTLPKTMASVGERAFAGCERLERLELPAYLEEIRDGTFKGCSSLREVFIPFNVKRIGTEAFSGCEELERLPHFVATGPKSQLEVFRTNVEESLPVLLESIGESAFVGCRSLTHVAVPVKVTTLAANTYKNCESLSTLWLHSELAEIAAQAFDGCRALEQVRVPDSLVSIATDAFAQETILVTGDGTTVERIADTLKAQVRVTGVAPTAVRSEFGHPDAGSMDQLCDDPEAMSRFVEPLEIRPSSEIVAPRAARPLADPVPSRFAYRDGTYHLAEPTDQPEQHVTIAMVGDLMCGRWQQRSALVDGTYDFSATFRDISPLLADADLSIGNLESMFCDSYPYTSEQLYVSDRPNLNAPAEYLSAVRGAGFDMVMNAQNHMYDTGVTGIVETLSAINHAQLVHGGAYLSAADQRFQLFEINGITLGVVSYLDQARQKMKQVNFTAEGLRTTASHFYEKNMRSDIAAAKAAGAEFILAYAHWGKEYTQATTARQRGFAQQLADAGADYIFGSHPHCPQHYDRLVSDDGRTVPVVFSGGNFASDIDRHAPYTGDTFVSSLTLGRNQAGGVEVVSDSYVPCRILPEPEIRGHIVVEPCTGRDGTDARPESPQDRLRIAEVMGRQYTPSTGLADDDASYLAGDDHDPVSEYSLAPAEMVAAGPIETASTKNSYAFDASRSIWARHKNRAIHEATLMLGGLIHYDRRLEQYATFGDEYDFRGSFRHLEPVLNRADLAVTCLPNPVADEFPSLGATAKPADGPTHLNARSEILDAANYAGFDVVASAGPSNLHLGVEGLRSTLAAADRHGLVTAGIGYDRTPLFDVNGIVCAVTSHTVDLYRTDGSITLDGADQVLSRFDEASYRQQVSRAREQGADVVISYLNCQTSSKRLDLKARRELAASMAEAGADYVACVNPGVLSRHEHHTTSDGRQVPMATSLGTLISGSRPAGGGLGALLQVTIRMDENQSITIDDSYIPVARVEYHDGAVNASVPLIPGSRKRRSLSAAQELAQQISDKLGDDIEVDPTRRVTVGTHYGPQLTPAQVEDILGVRFSAEDRDKLGSALNTPVPRFSIRTPDLATGCVAIIPRTTTVNHFADKVKPAEARKYSAVFAISTRRILDVPTLVLEDPWAAYLALMEHIRDKYAPTTIAVTGTAGKTTTKDLIGCSLTANGRALHVQGNGNTVTRVGNSIQKLSEDDWAYVQEVHEGTPGSASLISRMIKPSIAVITSVGEGHLDQMGSIDGIVASNLEVVAGLPEDGTLIVNDDNEHLKDLQLDRPVRIIRYGLDDPSVDYYARSVVDTGTHLSFDIVEGGKSHRAELNVSGAHNVSNALAAFAAADAAGVPAHKILAGLSSYRAADVRQNLVQAGSFQLYLDAYNSNLMALRLSLQTLAKLDVTDGNRRVAVLGDMGEQGDKVVENHVEAGRLIKQYGVDLLICAGPGMHHAATTAQELGVSSYHAADLGLLRSYTRDLIREGDAILFKAAGALDFGRNVIRPLFGDVM